MSQDGRRTSDEIEHEIHQTRARLDETLHEIEERFSPQKLMNTTYDYLRHGGAESAVSSLGRAIRENPLPVMVTGIGLGWLLLAQRRSSHDYDDQEYYSGGYPGSTMPVTRMPDGDDMPGSTFSGAGTTTMGHDPAALGAMPQHGSDEHGHGMTRKAQQMAGSIKERAQHMGSEVRGRAQHVSDQMRERAQHVSGQWRDRQHSTMQAVTHRARDAGAQTSHFVQDHPLVAGALGIAVGAVLGSLFSPTRTENRHLGELRDRAMHRAEEAGREQLERAEEKIHETAERFKEDARTAPSSNAPSYRESSSNEERFAKAGSTPTGADANTGRESAANKGGTGASGSPTSDNASGTPTPGTSTPSANAAGSSGTKPGSSGSTPPTRGA